MLGVLEYGILVVIIISLNTVKVVASVVEAQ